MRRSPVTLRLTYLSFQFSRQGLPRRSALWGRRPHEPGCGERRTSGRASTHGASGARGTGPSHSTLEVGPRSPRTDPHGSSSTRHYPVPHSTMDRSRRAPGTPAGDAPYPDPVPAAVPRSGSSPRERGGPAARPSQPVSSTTSRNARTVSWFSTGVRPSSAARASTASASASPVPAEHPGPPPPLSREHLEGVLLNPVASRAGSAPTIADGPAGCRNTIQLLRNYAIYSQFYAMLCNIDQRPMEKACVKCHVDEDSRSCRWSRVRRQRPGRGGFLELVGRDPPDPVVLEKLPRVRRMNPPGLRGCRSLRPEVEEPIELLRFEASSRRSRPHAGTARFPMHSPRRRTRPCVLPCSLPTRGVTGQQYRDARHSL